MTYPHTPEQREQIAKALVYRSVRRAIKPKDKLTVSEWADANRVLVEGSDAEHGQFRTDRNPPIREIQDMLSEHVPVSKVVFKGITQYAKTLIATNWMGYVISHAKGPMGLFMPTEHGLTDWNEQKFEPMTEQTASVRKAMYGRNSGNNSLRRKRYVGGSLYFRSAGSAADLKNVSLRYRVSDEVDEYKRDTGQGHALDLIKARGGAYEDGKDYICSSPTMKDASLIDEEFEKGDQRYYYVACPHCGEMQKLQWKNLIWDKIPGDQVKIKNVWYACEHHGCIIHEHEKTAMIEKGRWIAENPGAPYPSYTINALYMPVGMGTANWTNLVYEWLDAQGDPVKLMVFVNTRLGEVFSDATHDLKPETLQQRAEHYALRTVPKGCLLITCGVDVQSGKDARLEVQVLGHGEGKQEWTLDYHVIHGNPAGDEVWDALAEYINNIEFPNAYGKVLKSEATAIDTGGHHTHEVYNYVRLNRIKRPMAIKGASKQGQVILGKPSAQDVDWRGRTIKNGVKLYQVGTDTAKHQLYGLLNNDTDEEGNLKPVEERKIHHSIELPIEFFRGLTAETFNPKKNRWEQKKGRPNEPLDTRNYAKAAAHHPEIYMHKWKKTDWARRRALLEPEAKERAETQQEEPLHPTAQPDAKPQRKRKRKRAGNFATRW